MIEKASSNGHGVGVRSEPLKAAREADREAPAPTRAPRRKAAIAFGALALVLVAAVGVGYSLHASGYESTDDAFIEDLYNLIRNIHGSVEISLVTALIARRAQVHQAMLAARRPALRSEPCCHCEARKPEGRSRRRTSPTSKVPRPEC